MLTKYIDYAPREFGIDMAFITNEVLMKGRTCKQIPIETRFPSNLLNDQSFEDMKYTVWVDVYLSLWYHSYWFTLRGPFLLTRF